MSTKSYVEKHCERVPAASLVQGMVASVTPPHGGWRGEPWYHTHFPHDEEAETQRG